MSEDVVSVKMPTALKLRVAGKARKDGRSLSGHLRWLAEKDLEKAA